MLIAQYKLDERSGTAINDFIGSNNGTWSGAGVSSVASPVGSGLLFNGTDEEISIGDADIFSPVLTPFSITAWINMIDATSFLIISKGVYNTDGEWRFSTESGGLLQIVIFDENIADCFISRYYNTDLAIYENQWIHVAGTYDGGILSSGLKIYLNGKRVDDQDSNNATFASVRNLTHAIWIGRQESAYADGSMSDVRIYNEELSQARIVQIMQDGLYDRTLRNRIRR